MRGRFQKGCKPGPGRGKTTKGIGYAEIFRAALTPEAAFRIVEKAVEQAAKGDHKAREWIFKHVLRPQPQDLELPRFVTDSQIVTEADQQRAFFGMALKAARTVEQCEFLLTVARLVEKEFTKGGKKDDGAGVGAELGEGGDGSPVASEVR